MSQKSDLGCPDWYTSEKRFSKRKVEREARNTIIATIIVVALWAAVVETHILDFMMIYVNS